MHVYNNKKIRWKLRLLREELLSDAENNIYSECRTGQRYYSNNYVYTQLNILRNYVLDAPHFLGK